MKKITLFILLAISCLSLHAQVANTTGLPGDDLIYFEDMRFYKEHPAAPVSGYQVKVTTATTTPAGNSTIPADGLAAGQIGYTRPTNNVPAGDAIDSKSVRLKANTGTANHDTDIWIVVSSVDLSAYDGAGGSKTFTFSTRTAFREDGGTNLDDDNKIYYTTGFATGTDPTDGGVTWTEVLTTTPVGSSAAMGADGAWTTQSIDLSSITCGTQFAIAIRRQTSSNGPSGGVFSTTNNRNGDFWVSDLAYTGTAAPVSTGDFSALNISATGQTNVFNTPTASIDNANYTNTGTFANIFDAATSAPRLVNGDLAPANEGYKFEVSSVYDPIVVSEVRFKLANGTSNKGTVGGSAAASTWKVQGSTDDSVWDDLSDPITMLSANSSPNTATVALDITKAYRYYRLVLASEWTPNQQYTALQQMDFTVASLWTGTTDSDWGTTTNWNTGVVPTTHEVIIPSGLTNYPTIASGTAVATSNITIESGASLIANGTSTVAGNVTYKRNLTFTAGALEGWHLVSSPVVGETFNDDYVSANSIAHGTGSNRGIATYNNATGNWTYLQSAGSGTFGTGTGYSVKTSEDKDVSFMGTMNVADVDSAITVGAGTAFNLIGNPYTSYINSGSLLPTNTALLDSQTLWVWNPSTKNYDAKITGNAFKIAPGQGFFVKASSGGNFAISETTQSHETDTFLKSASKPEITLNITDGDLVRYAKIYYNDNATTGFDNGLDGETFSGVANKLDVFTHLLTNNSTKNYQIQSLPISDIETMIVPVGLKADAGTEITFSTEAINLPAGIKVFLEDRLNATFTRLDEANTNLKIKLNEVVNGVGRFYLHTRSNPLNTDNVELSNISIYKTSKSNLRIVGLQQGNARVKLYNILGKQVINTSFISNGVKNISLPKYAAGVYIVQLTTDAGQLNKKIILE